MVLALFLLALVLLCVAQQQRDSILLVGDDTTKPEADAIIAKIGSNLTLVGPRVPLTSIVTLLANTTTVYALGEAASTRAAAAALLHVVLARELNIATHCSKVAQLYTDTSSYLRFKSWAIPITVGGHWTEIGMIPHIVYVNSGTGFARIDLFSDMPDNTAEGSPSPKVDILQAETTEERPQQHPFAIVTARIAEIATTFVRLGVGSDASRVAEILVCNTDELFTTTTPAHFDSSPITNTDIARRLVPSIIRVIKPVSIAIAHAVYAGGVWLVHASATTLAILGLTLVVIVLSIILLCIALPTTNNHSVNALSSSSSSSSLDTAKEQQQQPASAATATVSSPNQTDYPNY